MFVAKNLEGTVIRSCVCGPFLLIKGKTAWCGAFGNLTGDGVGVLVDSDISRFQVMDPKLKFCA